MCLCFSRRIEPQHQNRFVPALQQQLVRVPGLPGRCSRGHDQNFALPRPSDPTEALPALWRQCTVTTQHKQTKDTPKDSSGVGVTVCVLGGSQVFLGGGAHLLQLQQDLIPRSAQLLLSYHVLRHVSQSLVSSIPVDIL